MAALPLNRFPFRCLVVHKQRQFKCGSVVALCNALTLCYTQQQQQNNMTSNLAAQLQQQPCVLDHGLTHLQQVPITVHFLLTANCMRALTTADNLQVLRP